MQQVKSNVQLQSVGGGSDYVPALDAFFDAMDQGYGGAEYGYYNYGDEDGDVSHSTHEDVDPESVEIDYPDTDPYETGACSDSNDDEW